MIFWCQSSCQDDDGIIRQDEAWIDQDDGQDDGRMTRMMARLIAKKQDDGQDDSQEFARARSPASSCLIMPSSCLAG